MLNYEPANSPFFLANKKYCENIESKLKTINLDCSGFCNSFGYEMETSLKKNNLTYHLKFEKHQSSRGGGVVPFNADDYAGLEISVIGLNKNFSVTVEKSSLKRLFSASQYKNKLPSPYFIELNYTADTNFVDELIKKIINDKISKFKLSDGKLTCKIQTATDDPLKLIEDLDAVIKNWA